MDYLYYLFIALVFLAVFLLLEGGYLVWHASQGPEARRVRERLQAISVGHERKDAVLLKQRLLSQLPAMHHLLLQWPHIHHLDRFLAQSGMPLMVGRFLGYTVASGLGGLACAAWMELPFVLIAVFAAVGGMMPYLLVANARNKRLLLIEQQLPEMIDLMAHALKAGHAFPGALQMAATEGAEPSAGEFRQVFEEVNFGVSMQHALMNLATRVPITDLRFFVIAVLIQRESGGNLAELLEKISELIRSRLALLGKVRVLSAEGRLSAWILSCLPFFMALLLNIVNPGFMSVLWTDPIGPKIIGIALGMMALGVFVISRIIKIRV